MPKETQTRKGKMPKLNGKAFFRPDTVDRENLTVEVVMTTGESGKRYDWYNNRHYMEELQIDENSVRTARLDKGIPLISDHSRWSGIRGVLGTTENYRFEDGQLIGTLRFSKRDEVSDIFNDVADGILRHVSLGYKVHKYERIRAEKEGELDTYRSVDLEPLEISLVQVPFESTNGVRFEENEGGRTERQDTELNEVEIIEEKAMPKPQEQSTQTRDDLVVKPASEVSTERTVESIEQDAAVVIDKSNSPRQERAMVADFVLAAEHAGVDIKRATEAFDNGVSIDAFRAEVLEDLGKRSSERKIVTQGTSFVSDNRQDEGQSLKADIEAQLLYRSDPSMAELSDGAKRFNSMSIMEMAREMLTHQNIDIAGASKMMLAERALHSTSDFPNILANVMNKSMRASYMEVPRTFMEFGRRASVSDFRPVHRMALGDAPDLKKLNESGEFERGSMSEEGEQYKIATYGRIFGITRQTLINDDLSAFTRLGSMWSASAARLQNRLMWGLILGYDFDKGAAAAVKMADGVNVFHASKNNLISGASSALGKEAFAEMRKMGRKQKTIDGKLMNISFTKLALPAELETEAEQLLLQTILPSTVGDTNPFRGKFSYVVEPLLDEVSQTAWYGFANTNLIDTFEYAFLQGEEELNLETRIGFDVDGMELRARTDFGGGIVDRRGMFKSAGA